MFKFILSYFASLKTAYDLEEGKIANVKFDLHESHWDFEPDDKKMKTFANNVRAGKLKALESEIESAASSGKTTSWGEPLHISMVAELRAPFRDPDITPKRAEKYLKNFKAWYDNSPDSPYAAAAYCYAIAATGYSYRGFSRAEGVSEEGWAKLKEYSARARDEFNQNLPRFRNHWAMALLYHAYGLIEGAELSDHIYRFENAKALISNSLELYGNQANILHDKWYGSYEQFEAHAVECAESNSHFGEGLYAAIYSHYMFEWDILESQCDVERLFKSFADWNRRFPSDFVRTRWAGFAFIFKRHQDCARLITRTRNIPIYEWKSDVDLYNAIKELRTEKWL